MLFAAALLALGTAPPARAADCPADRHDDTAVSAHVFDGDTLRLADGRRLRLLGIDTPEMGRDGAPPEPYAEAATRMLAELAPPGTRLHLRVDRERADRYGRTLAHVFLGDGVNVQARLLAAGLATVLVVPPNEWLHECYARIEGEARVRRAGIWALPAYQPVAATSLARDARGFRIVTGRVQRVGESPGNLWLNLAPDVALRIPRSALVHFGTLDPRTLAGRRLEARGMLQRRKGELRITIRHPAALTVLD